MEGGTGEGRRLVGSAGAVGDWRTVVGAILRGDDRLDIAANVEIADQLGPAGPAGQDELVEDAIHHGLVEDMLVAITVEIELEGAQLDNVLVGDESKVNRGEIRVPGERTETGELRTTELDQVISIGIGVR